MVNIVQTPAAASNFRVQNGIKKRHITLHTIVGMLSAADAVFRGQGRKASATYAIQDGLVHQYLPEKDYPFSDGNTYGNTYGISIEHAGGIPSLPKASADTHETSAQLCADISRRHFGGAHLQVGVNIFPHKHWVATACPGQLDVAWIAARANELLGGAAPASTGGGASAGTATGGYPSGTYNGYDIKTIQRAVGVEVDGVYGPKTAQGVKDYQARNGLAVDGIVGPRTWSKMTGAAVPASTPASFGISVDGSWGTQTTKALQRALGVAQDGVLGPVTYAALQRKVGSAADGQYGPNTRKALQRYLGVNPDGVVGPITVRALQQRLNAGTF